MPPTEEVIKIRDGDDTLALVCSRGTILCVEEHQRVRRCRFQCGRQGWQGPWQTTKPQEPQGGEKKGRAGHDSQSDQVKDSADVQVQRLLTLPILKGLKGASPTAGGVGHEDVHTLATHLLFDVADKLFNLVGMPDIGGHGQCSARDVGDGIELRRGLVEIRRVSRRDDHQLAAGLQ